MSEQLSIGQLIYVLKATIEAMRKDLLSVSHICVRLARLEHGLGRVMKAEMRADLPRRVTFVTPTYGASLSDLVNGKNVELWLGDDHA